jgi:hypothetical protein
MMTEYEEKYRKLLKRHKRLKKLITEQIRAEALARCSDHRFGDALRWDSYVVAEARMEALRRTLFGFPSMVGVAIKLGFISAPSKELLREEEGSKGIYEQIEADRDSGKRPMAFPPMIDHRPQRLPEPISPDPKKQIKKKVKKKGLFH